MASVIRHHPLVNALTDFEKEMQNIFRTQADLGNVQSDWLPAIDIKEEDKQYLIKADIPGIDPKDININIEHNVLSIEGEREKEHKEQREGFMRYEREKGRFCRRISLPDSVDAEKISATSTHGVLEISIPKQSQRIAKKIEVTHK